MDLSVKTTLDRPQAEAFAAFSDFDHFAKLGRKNGLSVGRMPADDGPQRWHVAGTVKGRKIDAEVVLVDYMPHDRLAFAARVLGMDVTLDLTFAAQGAQKTEVTVGLSLTPRTLAARLLLQPLKLQRGKLSARLEKGLKQLAKPRDTG